MASRFNFSTHFTSTARVVNEFGIRNSEFGIDVASCDRLLRICQDSINVPQTIAEHCKDVSSRVFTNAFISDKKKRMGNISILKEGG